MELSVMRIGTKNTALVRSWQKFLRGHKLYMHRIDGIYGWNTQEATRTWQRKWKLEPDGITGRLTIALAMSQGFNPITSDSTNREGSNWPPAPDFRAPASLHDRQALFGKFRWWDAPTKANPERIKIYDNWYEENITHVDIPQLAGIKGTEAQTRFAFHKTIADQVVELFWQFEARGLKDHIVSWGGSYCARYIRGSKSILSNHSFGTAFDINVQQNWLGQEPALVGEYGCVRELVPVANELGFAWLGHRPVGRQDGMHFEFAKFV